MQETFALSQDFELLIGKRVNSVHMGEGGWHITYEDDLTLIIPNDCAVLQKITIQ